MHRHDTRNCPICFQLIPLNTDEEYFFTHVQQCSRKVNDLSHWRRFVIRPFLQREQLAANAALAALANQHRMPTSSPPTSVLPTVQGEKQDR